MLSLNKSLLAAGIVLAVVVAGCGSSSSKTSSSETTAQKTNTNKKASGAQGKKGKKQPPPNPNACGKKQILPETETEGTCVQGAGKQQRTVTFVNGTSTLKLKELDIKVTKVSTPSSISGPAGTLKPKAGKEKGGKTIPKSFVVLSLSWKNNSGKTQSLNDKGKQLRIQSAAGGGPIFLPGEKADADSLYNAKPVKDGKKQNAVAVFQVPTKVADSIKVRGAHPQLAVYEFTTAGKQKEAPNGFIRLWNA
jgi:hypothetical protein